MMSMVNDRPVRHRIEGKPMASTRAALRFSLTLVFVLTAQASSAVDLLTQVHSKWAWSTYGTEVGTNGFVVQDLDGDGRSEILAATSLSGLDWWYQVNLEDRLLQTWSSFPVEGEEMELRGLELAQTPGGSLAVVMTENAVEVFDAASKRHLFDFETLSTDNRAIGVADLTGDGSVEAIVCDSQDLTVYDLATGMAMSFKAGYGCTDIAIGQVDADSQLEIALAGNPFAGYVLDGLTLLLNGGDLLGFQNLVALGDLNADGRDEVIFQRNWNLRAQDAVTGLLLWEHSVQPSWFGLVFAIAEMDSSPGLEVALADGFSISVLAGVSGTPLWTLPFPGSVNAMDTGDVDGDGLVDILWTQGCCSNGGAIFLSPGVAPTSLIRTDPFAGGIAGLSVGDFSGTGKVEVLTASAESSALHSGTFVALSFAQGRQLRRSSPAQTATLSDILGTATAQLDEDAQLEICGWSYYQPGVACFDGRSFEEEWSTNILAGIGTMSAAELDGTLYPELVTSTHSASGARITVQEGESGVLKWQSPPIALDSIVSVAAVDLYSNGNFEIVAALSPSGGACSSLARIDAEIGVPIGPPMQLDFFGMATRPPDPAEHLFLGLSNGDVAEIDLENGDVGAPIATFPGGVQAIELVDLTRDGVEDVVAAVEDGHLYLFDGALQIVTWESPYLGYLGSVRADKMLAGDFDGDTVPDLLIQTRTGIFAFEGPLLALFADGFESGGTTGWSATIP